jgi:nucleoside-diphosphate-sugar epimerase
VSGPALKGARVLVTGGTGFLGTYLWKELEARGARVRLFDYRASTLSGEGRPETLEGDVRDALAVARAVEGMDGVFHCAALPSIARGTTATYEAINLGGTRHVLEAARRAGARKVVYVSSSTVYGVPGKCPIEEDAPLAPQGGYSRTKLAAEEVCREATKSGLPVTIVRPRVILGPGRLGIFSLLFARVARGKRLFTIGPGTNRFQFTHVRDVVSACVLGYEHEEAMTVNAGSDGVLTVRSELEGLVAHARSSSRVTALPAGPCRLALRALGILGVAPLVHEQFSIADRDFILDTTRARERLGWKSTASNLQCLTEGYDWFVAHEAGRASDSLIASNPSDRQGGFQDDPTRQRSA